MESVTFEWNGVDHAKATVHDAIDAETYSLHVYDGSAPTASEVAADGECVIETDTDAGYASTIGFYVVAESDHRMIACQIYRVGETTTQQNDAVWDYDGADTLEVTFFGEMGVDYELDMASLGLGGGSFGSDTGTGAGAPMTLSAVNGGTDFPVTFYGELYVNGGDFNDVANRLFDPGVAGAGRYGVIDGPVHWWDLSDSQRLKWNLGRPKNKWALPRTNNRFGLSVRGRL